MLKAMKTVNTFNLVRTSYNPNDVTILLRDFTNDMQELDTAAREKMIQSGVHYSEMLPKEEAPTQEYNEIYSRVLEKQALRVSTYIAELGNKIMKIHGYKPIVLISLARAGIPVGILLKRYIERVYNMSMPHYSVSIIRGKGIDKAAMEHIYAKHGATVGVNHFQFVDGWTGKGMIGSVLDDAIRELEQEDVRWRGLYKELAVVSDPAMITNLCGTHMDILIPSACLNSTVSGLISRSIKRAFDTDTELHGACYFGKFSNIDKTYEFINAIEKHFVKPGFFVEKHTSENGLSVVDRIKDRYGVEDINLIKPGIGEATRVLLRRVPWKILISNKVAMQDKWELDHIIQLCSEKGVPYEYADIGNYKVCGIIKDMSADA